MNEIFTIEEINAAPSLDWDALIEWRDKIDAKLEEISEAVGEGEWHVDAFAGLRLRRYLMA